MSIGFEDLAMTSTLIDSNILIDLMAGGPHFDLSREALFQAKLAGPLILSALVWAEIAHTDLEAADLKMRLGWLRLQEDDFPFEAGFIAGKAHRLYRSRGGGRERTLPDFLIGAHALVGGHRLLTRDSTRYRSYFPDLAIVTPEGSA